MMRMTLAELKKLLMNPLLLVMLPLLLGLDLYRIYDRQQEMIGQYPQHYAAQQAEYDKVSGAWDDGKIQYVLSEYRRTKAIIDAGGYSTEPGQPGTKSGYIFGDYGIFGQIKTEMEAVWHYGDTINDVLTRAEENAAFYAQKGNRYSAALNEKIAKTYQNRRADGFYDTSGVRAYLAHDFSTLLILLLLILLLSPLFAREHELDMHGLLQLTPNAEKLPVCKLAAGGLAVCGISLLFFAADFLAFSYLYRIRGLSQPLWTVAGYEYTPLNISIGAYLMLNAAFKLLCFLVIGSLCAMFSAVSKKELIPFCGTFVTALVLFLADAFSDSLLLHRVSPVSLCTAGNLFRRFEVIRIGNTPVPAYWLPVAAAGTALILICVLTVQTAKRGRAK